MGIIAEKGETIKIGERELTGRSAVESRLSRFENSKLIIALLMVAAGIVVYEAGLIVWQERQRPPVTISDVHPQAMTPPTELSPIENDGEVVASKTGQRYYYPWCGGAGRIGAKNKVIFPSAAAAVAAGYTKALNCKGL